MLRHRSVIVFVGVLVMQYLQLQETRRGAGKDDPYCKRLCFYPRSSNGYRLPNDPSSNFLSSPCCYRCRCQFNFRSFLFYLKCISDCDHGAQAALNRNYPIYPFCFTI